MAKVSFEDFIRLLNYDLKGKKCIEISFCIDDDQEYDDCWIGIMPDREDRSKDVYWYGLVRDGSQAYDYSSVEDILNAKVFRGQSLCDIYERITWTSLFGCDFEEMLTHYIGKKQ